MLSKADSKSQLSYSEVSRVTSNRSQAATKYSDNMSLRSVQSKGTVIRLEEQLSYERERRRALEKEVEQLKQLGSEIVNLLPLAALTTNRSQASSTTSSI